MRVKTIMAGLAAWALAASTASASGGALADLAAASGDVAAVDGLGGALGSFVSLAQVTERYTCTAACGGWYRNAFYGTREDVAASAVNRFQRNAGNALISDDFEDFSLVVSEGGTPARAFWNAQAECSRRAARKSCGPALLHHGFIGTYFLHPVSGRIMAGTIQPATPDSACRKVE